MDIHWRPRFASECISAVGCGEETVHISVSRHGQSLPENYPVTSIELDFIVSTFRNVFMVFSSFHRRDVAVAGYSDNSECLYIHRLG